MNWKLTEFLLKGIYLGLLLVVALCSPSWQDVANVAFFTVGGLAICLGIAAIQKLREGFRVRGRLLGFLLFLILENPRLVYAGLVVGLTCGAYLTIKNTSEGVWLIFAPIVGGILLGLAFWYLKHVRRVQTRRYLGLGLTAGIICAAILFLYQQPDLLSSQQRFMIGVLLLIGIPGFYILTFASLVEESEVEIAAICAALGVGLCFLSERLMPSLSVVGLVVPLLLYYVYTRRILPGLRVFKHALRGLSYSKVGQVRPALMSLNRALELDPQHPLARETLWELHRRIDFDDLQSDPATLEMVNFGLCLERAGWLLVQPHPTAGQIDEAQRLLDLVREQRPPLAPACAYWQAVAFVHQKRIDDAVVPLESLLREPAQDSPARRDVLFQGWQLALLLHPEMNRRVGRVVLQQPGRRMEAIAAVERKLAKLPDDQAAWDLKRLLYAALSEAEYNQAALPPQEALECDHTYLRQLGLALIEDAERWQRGCDYLRLAARGLKIEAPSIYMQIARVHDQHGDSDGKWAGFTHAIQVGRRAGVANLTEEDRTQLFAVVKELGDHARASGDLDTALDAYKFYSQFERSGIETYRILADLFEHKKDVWMALHCTEHALTYDENDRDLRERKDRYYYSITPEDLKSRWSEVHKWFDVDYCINRARGVLERFNGDLDLLDWAEHLTMLAEVAQPASIQVKLMRGRIFRLRGMIGDAVALLEDVRKNKPEKFPSESEHEAWYYVNRLLGDMYLEEKPEQAIPCFMEFRNSDRSGADTSYKLGRAYEAMGDLRQAARFYESVTTFDQHPLYHEAAQALERVRGGGTAVAG